MLEASGKGLRRRVILAALIGAALSALILFARARGSIHDTAMGDGAIARYIAAHFDAEPAEVHPVVAERGTSLRYGRAGMPAAIWLLAAGRRDAMPWSHATLTVLSGAVAAAAAAALMSRAHPWAPLLPFLAPGFPLAVSGGFAEAFAVPLVLLGIWAALRRRWFICAGAMAGALLTRENTAPILLVLVVLAVVRRAWAGAGALALAVVPTAAWYAFVAQRFGHIPPLDPYLRVVTETVGPPFVALYDSLTDAASLGSLITLLVHLGAWGVCIALIRRSLFAVLGAVTGVQLLVSGPFAWELIGEAARTAVFLQLFTILALVDVRTRSRSAEREHAP